jgi:hypothetical protein
MEKSDLEEEKKRTEVKNGRDPPKGLPYPLPLPALGGGRIILQRHIDGLELYLEIGFC